MALDRRVAPAPAAPAGGTVHEAASTSRVGNRAKRFVRRFSDACDGFRANSGRPNQQLQLQVSSIYRRNDDEPENHELSACRRTRSNGT